MLDLFADESPWQEPLAEGAVILRRFAHADAGALIEQIDKVAQRSPFCQMVTPGYTMSVAMTIKQHGYLYSPYDPLTGQRWPAMPCVFQALSDAASKSAGYPDFSPDACLINRYAPGAKLSLHQDKDEPNLQQPIVSVSLGLPAIFQFGGLKRNDALQRVIFEHGDVVVWGGASRLFYHGILPLKSGHHLATGEARFNLTFRCAGKSE